MGGVGSDTYRFGHGDGHDVISEDSWDTQDIDRIELKVGIASSRKTSCWPGCAMQRTRGNAAERLNRPSSGHNFTPATLSRRLP